MNTTTPDVDLPNDLTDRALKLPPAARLKLADLLYDSVEPSADDPEVVRKEWNAEIARRIEGFLDGSIPTVDAEESLARIERELREKYPQ